MRDVIPSLGRCTIEHANGKFCDSPSMKDAPFPICAHHAIKLYKHMLEAVQARVLPKPFSKSGTYTARQAKHQAAVAEQSVVYYVRIHDHIKIGYTTNVKRRVAELRVNKDAVLATEPGGRELEADRHKQFADIRIGAREDFMADPRLMAHIEDVRDFHGKPHLTGYVRV